MKTKELIAAVSAVLALSGAAFGHAGIQPSEAPAGKAQRVAISIGHGCDGQATHTVRVQIPDGFYSAKAMAKPGWDIATQTGAYAVPFDNHGKQITEGVREITWTGGNLADDQFDDFILRGAVGPEVAPGTVLYFATVQECADGTADWTDTSGNAEAANPAPGLTVVAGDHAPVVSHQAGDLTVTNPFARATPPRAPVAGGFLTVANHGAEDDRLVSVSAPFSDRAEIHEMAMEGDTMKMRQLPDGLPIPAGQTVELKPGGYHLMFMDLKAPLVEGDVAEITLTFEKAGELVVPLAVGPMNMGANNATGHKGH